MCYTLPCAYWGHTVCPQNEGGAWASQPLPALISTPVLNNPFPLGGFVTHPWFPQGDKLGLALPLSLCILQICSLLAFKGAPGGVCPPSVLAHTGTAMGQLAQSIYNPNPHLSLGKHRHRSHQTKATHRWSLETRQMPICGNQLLNQLLFSPSSSRHHFWKSVRKLLCVTVLKLLISSLLIRG